MAEPTIRELDDVAIAEWTRAFLMARRAGYCVFQSMVNATSSIAEGHTVRHPEMFTEKKNG